MHTNAGDLSNKIDELEFLLKDIIKSVAGVKQSHYDWSFKWMPKMVSMGGGGRS